MVDASYQICSATPIYSAETGLDMLTSPRVARPLEFMKRQPLEEVVRRHLPSVWRVLRRAGVAEADCDDVCQEVFCTYSMKEGSVSAGAEKSYAIGIALRKAADYRKSRGRRPWTVAAEHPQEMESSSPDPEATAVARQELAQLDVALAELKDEYREVFVLVELEQLTLNEAAVALGLSSGTVSSRLHRGRDRFAAALRRAGLAEGGR